MIVSFALGAGLIAAVLAVSVYTLSRSYMVDQRERSAGRQAAAHAEILAASLPRLAGSDRNPLASFETPVDTFLVLQWKGRWVSSDPAVTRRSIPESFVRSSASKNATERSTLHVLLWKRPYLIAAVHVDGGTLFELAPTSELRATLRILTFILCISAVVAAVGAALLGWQASKRVLTPLKELTEAAVVIAAGDLDRRLTPTADRELADIANSFNSMVDSLQSRIERERRFFGDVSHELRTPLTTLITSAGVLERHRDAMPARSQQAVSLMNDELHHLRGLLEDLITLARIDAGLHQDPLELFPLSSVLLSALGRSRHPAEMLTVESQVLVEGRRKALERAFLNLIRNGDSHGRGLRAVTLGWRSGHAVVWFDDAGPGVDLRERERIFERFATGHGGRRTTSGGGTGIGLAIVAETASAHLGSVRCAESPQGGARFEVTLPGSVMEL